MKRIAVAIGALVAVAAYALREKERPSGSPYYDPANPRHRDPEYVLLEDGFMVEESGLIEGWRSGTLGASATQQTRMR